MINLEKSADIKNNLEYVLVPMHKLTTHKLIKNDIKSLCDISDLPSEILISRFFFEIKIRDAEDINKEVKFYGNKAFEYNNDTREVLSIKIRFLLSYFAASKEYQKINNKITIPVNSDINK